MNRDFLYRFLSSTLAVGTTVVLFLVLTAAVVFRIIPWWLYFVLLLVGALGVVAYAIVSEWLAMKRDRSFVDGMREQGETRIGKEKARDRDSIREMHERWLAGFEQLQSTLGKKGGRRAVYYLPWYVIIGKPATGKTTAIRNAGLHFAVSAPKLVGTGGTRNCDWFFTEEAILIDTAGRYSVSSESESDKKEWHEFLGLMRKYRPDMPINGLLVAVAADDLVEREREEVIADAREMRKRIDELMTELGIQFPVYLLVTKCDLIQGFTEFFGKLDRARLTELLGWTSPSFEIEDLEKTIDDTFQALVGRCKRLRSSLLRDESDPQAQMNVYLFPEELSYATKMLAQYCDVLFRQSKFSDAPFLRGVYFNSAMQTGNAISHTQTRLGLKGFLARTLEGKRSFFLQDFFEERLAADQKLVQPTGRATTRLRVFNNLGLGIVAGVCVLAGLLFTASYVGNRRLLLSVQDAIAATAEVQNKTPQEQIALLDQYRQAIEELRHQNQHPSWLERFGLYTGTTLEAPTVERFLGIFEKVAYQPAIDSATGALQRTEDPARAFAALETLIAHLQASRASRNSQLETGGESLAKWLPGLEPDDEAAREQFARAYRFYLREPWQFGANPELKPRAEQERADLVAVTREKLPLLLTTGTLTRWLEKGKEIRVTDVHGYTSGTAKVRPVFTDAAWKKQIVPLFSALEQIQEDVGPEDATRLARDYSREYFAEWFGFAEGLKDPGIVCRQGDPYFEGLLFVERNTTEPFRVPSAGKGGAEAGAEAAKPAAYLPGFEPPPWVKTVGQVGREKNQYHEKVAAQACKVDTSDPCAAAQALKDGPGGASAAQLRSWIRDGLVGVSYGVDDDDRRLREGMAALLVHPLDRAGEGSRQACEQKMRDVIKGALGGLRFKGPWEITALERVCPKVGAVWQACEQELAPFFNCSAVTPKPNAPVQVPADIVSQLKQADRLGRVWCGPNGLRTHTLSIESLPTFSDGAAKVETTTLSVLCDEAWELSHHQTKIRKNLSWNPATCSGVRLEVEVDGGPMVEMERQGPFALFELLAAAKRSGKEYSWTFPEDHLTVSFNVSAPEGTVEYFR